MGPDMTVPDEQPEFDPATWTPDKPWPKGYYKPIPGLIDVVDRQDRTSGDNAGFRRFFWALVVYPLQLVALIATASNHFRYGLMHDIAEAFTPAPLFLLLALVLPTLLHVGIVAPEGAKTSRSFAYGLVCAMAMLVFTTMPFVLRPLLTWLFNWIVWLLS